jgi:hypothetical protein
MLHKDYDRKYSAEKKNIGRGSQEACRQDELIGGKTPVVKYVILTLVSNSGLSSNNRITFKSDADNISLV